MHYQVELGNVKGGVVAEGPFFLKIVESPLPMFQKQD